MRVKAILCAWVLLTGPGLCLAGERYLQAGFGNFEGFNAGLLHKKGDNRLFYGYGSDFNIYGQGFYHCIFLGAGRNILQKYPWTMKRFSVNMCFNVWNLENKSNVFSVVSIIPELHYTLPLKTKYKLQFYAGYAYSSVFRYKRKGFYEIGWPDEWMPNFGFAVQCLLQ